MRLNRPLAFLILLPILAACGRETPTSGSSLTLPPTPPPPPVVCPVVAKVPAQPEPLPPAGIGVAKLHEVLTGAFGQAGDDFMRWIGVEYPGWARTNAADRATLVEWCAKQH